MTRPDNDPARLRVVAETLAAEAAEFVRSRRAELFGAHPAAADESDAVRAKSTPTDPVTVVDTDAERLLRSRLAQLRPGDPIVGEEGGGPADSAPAPDDAVTWVLDPIDGTVNFVYGIPAYAVSIGAQVGGVSVAGAVADVVGRSVYSAALGQGAHVTDEQGTRELRCTAVEDLSMALLGTGFGYSAGRRATQAALLARMLPMVRDVRRIGSAALDLCMVAAGRLDAYYEHGLQLWDRAAGALIAAEAGARVVLPASDVVGAGLVVAAAPGVADELLGVLKRLNALEPLD
ncbi:inositol monophosphatase family protein [Mycobacterium ulcerans]|uniref:Inositol-1-monophosphatase n=4 Tax=Mycobacteriaceae TaxID=1762 RepID=A0A9N7LP13_9MYCO|nr:MULTISPECIES: inositol monophosphatase family protein [Mycobacterium]ULL10361.1 inositol monophosphatase [Mycobacterium liflandii]ABL05525.1 extragenic suppressor protein SuhB [Mycobacterium ulcerans Agy99]EPQ79641.1 Inositol-1-monophosphatase [Mycobacterium marinum str. Europe]MEB3905517.1 inositol monophosphatase family protein [Mycobacterium ulcerans]MEB3909693.1 inositol monophosphatase family protein [Mycobacterium ulcerans]